MSGYGIEDVPRVTLDDAQLKNLDSQEENQKILMAEAVIQVSETDQVVGPVSKLDAHYGAGSLHRAFRVLLFN